MSSANEPHMLSEQACPQQFPHRELGAHTVAGVRPESKVQGIIDLLDNVYRTGETFLGNELMMQLEPMPAARSSTRTSTSCTSRFARVAHRPAPGLLLLK